MVADHIKRITLDVEGDVSADDARDILDAVFAKLGSCWSENTEGPIHDDNGKHVANARVQVVPFDLQMAREVKASGDLVEAVKWAAAMHDHCEHAYATKTFLSHSDFCIAMHAALGLTPSDERPY